MMSSQERAAAGNKQASASEGPVRRPYDATVISSKCPNLVYRDKLTTWWHDAQALWQHVAPCRAGAS